MKQLKIRFWGVRGSIPTPGPSTIRYGGNTSCVELQFPQKPLFILDAGSGIRELGKELLLEKNPVTAHIFISHFHWDHIQGLPFFKPAFQEKNHFFIYGCDEPHLNLNQIISFQMDPTYFPVAIDDMKAKIEFKAIREENFEIDGVQIRTKFLNHPGYALGYRFDFNEKSVVYISDNEPFLSNPELRQLGQLDFKMDSIEDLFENFIENKDEELLEFIRDATVLIHDSQYFPEEYESKITWGHSPYNYTVELAYHSRAKNLILFHHDPDHDDDTVDMILEKSRQRLNELGYQIPCYAAREGEILYF